MRPMHIIVGAVLITAFVALLTARISSAEFTNTRASVQPISIVEMMSTARNLPVQVYDAI